MQSNQSKRLASKRPGRRPIQFKVELELVPVALPPEKEAVYRLAWRIVGKYLYPDKA